MTTIDPSELLTVADAADGLGTYAKLRPDTVRALVAAYESLGRVEALHAPHGRSDDLHCATHESTEAGGDGWPCATRVAITGGP